MEQPYRYGSFLALLSRLLKRNLCPHSISFESRRIFQQRGQTQRTCNGYRGDGNGRSAAPTASD
jgi:hypothetical protein